MASTSLLIKAALLATVTVTSGCGFQLRGAAPVSAALQPLSVQCVSNVPAQLCNAVTDQLALGGVTLADPAQASYRLRLTRFEQSRRASAITLQGAAAEYDLRQRVWVDLQSSSGLPLIAETELNASESYRYDEDQVLAKRREQQDIETALYQRLAQQVIFRLTPMTDARIKAIEARAQAQPPLETDEPQ
ncbi:LPS-assembly lipoprotein LptE [Marinobacter zhejiangensis]|uniref:LPS-assembly lipoprotein LptE n=1 Tax=Marinobacter zhejiangensis TaxID=488535 RepID=A0A1I4QK05_9GAMM|nr:LPS assembly lipoprotein LptE [Marinobacter zhejiangensis]SFM40364.1 LPS-assembly lipoprotein [Marinobacter zhejiangensis]